ncbi:MAG TPA: type IV pilus secretin PilQ family protein [Pseudomonadales bacterium]|nr:type IV pilus secretin PilQ family protein [Pseudomonadales bacterium]
MAYQSNEIGQKRGGFVKSAIRLLMMALPLLLPVYGNAKEAVKLENIAFSALPGGRFEVRMDFDSVPPEPQGYTIDKPARVVLDFANVESALKEKKFPLSFGSAKSANVLSDGGRTRLILNMAALEAYQTRTDGNTFVMTVGSNDVRDVSKSAASLSERITASKSVGRSSIENIDFRRDENGEGKIIISMTDSNAGVNVEDAGGKIVLNFNNTQLPLNLRRKLDVTDFATPVVSVSSDYDGSNSVVSISATGNYDYMAYQADSQYVVSIKQLSAKEQDDKKQKFNYIGDKLSLNFQDIPVRSVLQLIADFTELNLVASDTVDGKITLRLENVPWDQALDLVLKTKGLDKRQVGNVLMVAPAAEIAAREREQLETAKQLQELAPLRTEFVQVLYADAEEIFKLFGKDAGAGKDSNTTQGILSSRGSAIVDKRTNSIIITETEEKIQKFRDLIKKIDIPVRQVSIEARIVKANTDFSHELGVRWGVTSLPGKIGPKGYVAGGMNGVREVYNGKDVTWTNDAGGLSDSMVVDFAATASNAGSIALGFLNGSDNLLALELSAMEGDGRGEVVSQPKVVTGDKQKAIIKSGQEIAYQEASSSGATSTSFKELVLKLEVTPQITPDNKVMMDLNVTKDALNHWEVVGVSGKIPVIDTMGLTTNILVDNGQTIVLGGIFETSDSTSVSKLPFLGDLPVLGTLFRHTYRSDSKSELLIFITPRLLQDPLANKH